MKSHAQHGTHGVVGPNRPTVMFAFLATVLMVVMSITLSSCAGYTTAAAKGGGGGGQPGTPGAGILSTSATSLSFGNMAVGSSASQSINVTNTGTAAVNISQVTISGTGFTMAGLAPQTIDPGLTSLLTVKFEPTSSTSVSGSVSITSNAPDSPLTINLSGTGVQAQTAVNPASASFGTVVVGNSNSQPIMLTNGGNTTLTFSQVTPAGTGFSVTGLSTSTTVAAGGHVNFNVVFTPASTATIDGSLTLVTNGKPSPLVINLSGSGASATRLLGTSPTSLSFNTVPVGSSKSLTATLTNSGNSSVNISGVTVTGAGFSTSGVSNGTILTAGQSATLTVTFAPTSAGAVTGANVQITSNATNSPSTIPFSGTGQAAVSHSVALSWTASTTSTVSGYNIFRAPSSGGYGATPLNSSPVSGTTYTDTTVAAGQTYFYVTTAVDSGVSSIDSNEVSATILTP